MEDNKLKEKPSLSLSRRFSAPPEKVWRAWTDPQALTRWFGPDAGKVSLVEIDVRVGGRFHVVFSTLDGEQHDVSGVYREVQPNRKLVFTWAWKSTPERVSLLTLTFQPIGSGTEFNMLHEQLFDVAARDRHEYGWTGSLAKLERFLHGE
ncbi:MAG TPA: SRPBCC domain-containing protein [Burkholderiales bacterium]|nr:SRPBCC domain-containing protein [Burkholderiales bacterium]